MHECLLPLFNGLEPVVWNEGIVREVRACRKDGGGCKGEASRVSADREVGLVCGTGGGVGVAERKEGIFTRGEDGWGGGTRWL
jgi:hypothetical protein